MANQRVKGIVTKVDKSKFGFYIRLADNPLYFNTKFEPKCNVGDEVGVEYERKTETGGQIKSVTVLNAGAAPPAQSWDATPSGAGPSTIQVYANTNNRQDSIIWQHSQEIAVRLIGALGQAGGLPKVKAGEDARAMILSTFNALTAQAFADAENPRKSAAFLAYSEQNVEVDAAEDTQEPADAGDWSDKGDDVNWS